MSESSTSPITTTTSSNNSNTNTNTNNKITIRYRFGMAPDHKIETDPSLMETVRAMNKIDGAVFLGTVLAPSFYGYRLQSTKAVIINQITFIIVFLESFSGVYFKFGLATGLFAGAVYAYCRSYTRLTGIFIATPKYQVE